MKNLFLALAYLFALPALAGPNSVSYQDDIMTIDGRDFYIPDYSVDPREYDIKIPMHNSPQIQSMLSADPILGNQRVYIAKTGIPARELFDSDSLGSRIELENVETNDFDLHLSPPLLGFVPQHSSIEFSARCGQSRGNEQLLFCDVNVIYPFATHIRLQARQSFPGEIPKVTRDFEKIATRLLEVFLCLDVTDVHAEDQGEHLEDLLFENPTLENCEPELRS